MCPTARPPSSCRRRSRSRSPPRVPTSSCRSRPEGSFYVAGWAAASAAGDRLVIVAKIGANGAPDTSFGAGGAAMTSMIFAGGNDEIDVVVQPSGKIVVAATIPSDVTAGDRDVGFVRLDAGGAVDGTFGSSGFRRFSINTALDGGTGALSGIDALRALAVGADGALYFHGAGRNKGAARTDTDFVVGKLDVDGSPVAAYGADGDATYRLDIDEAGATPRSIVVLADGSVYAAGYANTTTVGDTVQPVIFNLDPSGKLVTGRLFHEPVLARSTEVYGLALHGDTLITGGYGRETGDTNDWVSLKLDLTNFTRDTSYGGAAKGAVIVKTPMFLTGSACRGAVALPGGRTLLFGTTGTSNTPEQTALFGVIDANGALDPSYDGAVHAVDYGTTGADAIWSAAVSGNNVLLAGYRGHTSQTDTENDDSYVTVIPLR
ncbi:MAG: delta-60 repeat domain-containing protein [Labilithrix sp.]|nr:delta-60 repeat domain-containing protein [Labilithrix sp.]MCW5810295.1 delta-60 repeat domain-containing protein [Labilithrix sp.]